MVEFEEPDLTAGTLVHCRVTTRPMDGVCRAVLGSSDSDSIELSGATPSHLHWWCLAEMQEGLQKATFIKPVVDSGITRLRELEFRELLRFDLTQFQIAMENEEKPARDLCRDLESHFPLVFPEEGALVLDTVSPGWPEPRLSLIGHLLYDYSSFLLGLTHVWDARSRDWLASPPASVGLDFGNEEILWLQPPWKARPYGNTYADRLSNFDRGVKAVLIRDQSEALVTRLPCSSPSAPRDISTVQREAQAGDRQAQFELGLAYENGEAVERDSSLALEWFTRAAEQWHGEALWKLGQAYLEGLLGMTTPDPARAARWLERAATEGIAEAYFPLAELYRTGVGLEQNLSRARECYSTAGHKGSARGMLLAGKMFARGEGGNHCYASAHWFLSRAASEHGLEEAELELGYLHQRRGETEEAQEWFRRAARHGNQEAARHLTGE